MVFSFYNVFDFWKKQCKVLIVIILSLELILELCHALKPFLARVLPSLSSEPLSFFHHSKLFLFYIYVVELS